MTSPAQDIVDRLAARGVHLGTDGDRLVYDGPAGVVTDEVRSQLAGLKPELLALLGPREQRRPLEPAEQHLWMLEGRSGPGAYVLTGAFRLTGRLDLRAFQEAVDDAVARHASLRARVVEQDGSAELVAAPTGILPVRVHAATTSTLAAQLAELVSTGIDLSAAPLFRVDVLVLGAEEHVVLVRAHHIVGDDFSVRVFCEHVLLRYEEVVGLSTLQTRPRSDLAPSSSREDDPAHRRLVLARRAALEGIPHMWLPGPAPDELADTQRTYDVAISRDTGHFWDRVRREIGATSFALVVAMLTVAVRAAGGPDEQLVGSSQTGRGPRDHSSIGYYARPVVVGAHCSASRTFGDHARAVAVDLADAAAVGGVPIDDVVGKRALSERGGYVLFAVAYAPVHLPRVGGLTVTPVAVRSQDVRHDLRLEARLGDEMHLTLTWRPELVSTRFVAAVARALENLAAEPPGADEAVADVLARLVAGSPHTATSATRPDAIGLARIAARRRRNA